MPSINDALANKIWDTIMNGAASIAMLDLGHSEWRTAPRAASANAVATGVLVADIVHAADGSGAPGSRTVNLAGTMADTSTNAAGVVAWVRFRDAADTYRIDASAGEQGPAINITAAAIVGGLAQITAAAHGRANGDMIEIAGNSVPEANSKWIVFNVTANTFQILLQSAPGANGTARLTFEVVINNADLEAGQEFDVLSMAFTIPLVMF